MNKDYTRRDTLICGEGKHPYYIGGCYDFYCDWKTLNNLVKEGFADPNECQNDSPSIKEFLELTEGLKGIKFKAYAVSPERQDYRITVDGIEASIYEAYGDDIAKLVQVCHEADEFDFSHEGYNYILYAWWD